MNFLTVGDVCVCNEDDDSAEDDGVDVTESVSTSVWSEFLSLDGGGVTGSGCGGLVFANSCQNIPEGLH